MNTENINIPLKVNKFGSGELINVFDLIKTISKDLEQFQRSLNGDLGITPAQFSVLNIIKENTPYSPSLIAKLHKSTRPTITGILDTLEKKNLIIRQLNKADRRKFDIFLTKKGLKVKKQIPEMEDLFGLCCTDLKPQEISELTLLLEKLSTSLNSSCLQYAKKNR